MRPKPFRLEALLGQREREKDQAARACAPATQAHRAALQTLTDLDARYAGARAALSAGLAREPAPRLRDAFATLEALSAMRPRLAERARSAEEKRDQLAARQLDAAKAWKAVAILKDKALAAQRAYEALIEDAELSESNLALAARSPDRA